MAVLFLHFGGLAHAGFESKCVDDELLCEINGESEAPVSGATTGGVSGGNSGTGSGSGAGKVPPPPPRFVNVWNPVEEELGECSESGNGTTLCGPERGTCEFNGSQVIQVDTDVFDLVEVGPATEAPDGGENFEGTRRDTVEGSESSLGYACMEPGEGATSAGGEPVVIAVTQSDFAKLPVSPPQAHAGPEAGWIPVNMVVVLHASGEDQVLETTILDTPVSVRAVPIEYSWDLGDGNTITTTKPGQPYPSTEVASEYRYEGWYDVTLTTTFAGQFSVDGGEWQDIDGTITVESEPVEIFSKSLESRLVNGDVPVDEEEDPWIPPRTDETEGSPDPNAQNRSI
ncbi:hypothetical protein [Brachybacterium sp.]|uniref:hypothetical protein n=1 Tax=Brachybacterium sp. TaxID=1891286 RepID=UPI002ED5328A